MTRDVYTIELTDAQREVLQPLVDALRLQLIEHSQSIIGQLDSDLSAARFTLLSADESLAVFAVLNPGDTKFNAAKIKVNYLVRKGYIAKYPRSSKPEAFYTTLECNGFVWTGELWTNDVVALQVEP